MGSISSTAQSAVNAITGDANAMVSVPELENDPQATRKLAVAVFNLVDALKAADKEIAELRAQIGHMQGTTAQQIRGDIRPW